MRISHPGHVVCTRCSGLRSVDVADGSVPPDLCQCVRGDGENATYSREQQIACSICATCALAIAPGHTRYRMLHCTGCLPLVRDINERSGRLVVPIGIHSLLNRIAHVVPRSDEPSGQSAAVAEFAGGFGAMVAAIDRLGAHRDRVVARNLRETGLDDRETVDFERYVNACLAAGLDARNGRAALETELVRSTPAPSGPSGSLDTE